jgi:antitoxin HicB
MTKDLAYYLSLNYPIELTRDEGFFVAAHPDLPGCIAQGDTADEAIASLDDAREAWIEVGIQDKQFIPEPLPEEFSGRLSLRMPPTLHADLAHQARRQGVSLSQFIVTALAGAVGLSKGAGQEAKVGELARLASELKAVVDKMTAASAEPPSILRPPRQALKRSVVTTGLQSDDNVLSFANRGGRAAT